MPRDAYVDILGVDDSNDLLFILFIPSRDKNGVDLADHRQWVEAAARLLGRLFNGSTVMPPAQGTWLNPESNELIYEEVVLVHSYTKNEIGTRPEIIEEIGRFVHRMGNQTNQGEVGIVIDNTFHRIRNFTLA